MSTLHRNITSAVVHTRLHTPVVPAQAGGKSGAAGASGCERGAGRRRPAHIAAAPEPAAPEPAVASRGEEAHGEAA
ncbi:SigE family RNA polymerase sigma factor, partial [Streptomyces sp. S1A]|nr:SigE family RNA polymerase sigma factor [Streptomyces sp. ICN903]